MNSQVRRSTTKENHPTVIVQIDEEASLKDNKQTEFQLHYNSFLELTDDNKRENKSKYRNYLIKKYIKTDRILSGIQLATFVLLFIIQMVVGQWSYATLALKVIAILLLPFIIILYRQSIKSKAVNVLVTAFQAYIIVVMVAKQLIVKS